MNLEFYNIDISCNYRELKNDEESDLVYRKNLIEVFNLQNDIMNDDLFEKMSSSVDKLKDYLEEKDLYKHIEELVKRASKSFIFEDYKIGFMLLFSYDFFDEFHILIKQILMNKEKDEEHYKMLLDKFGKCI
jgi:hypothetical protein